MVATNFTLIIIDLLQAQNDKLEKYGSYNKPLLPIIHGTLPKPWEQQRNSGSNANKITIRTTKYRTLRMYNDAIALIYSVYRAHRSHRPHDFFVYGLPRRG